MTTTQVYVCAKCNAICTNVNKNGKCQDCTRNKYNARRVIVDGRAYASQKEANDHMQLLQREQAGEITNLREQMRYPLVVNGVKVCTYVADHVYDLVATGETEVCDSKGMATQVYKMKKKLVKAIYNIDIVEI